MAYNPNDDSGYAPDDPRLSAQYGFQPYTPPGATATNPFGTGANGQPLTPQFPTGPSTITMNGVPKSPVTGGSQSAFVDPSTNQPTGPGTTAGAQSGASSNPLFSGMDPRLVSLFEQYGITPTGPGTGNSDIAYWNSKITAPGADASYYLGRLAQDFQGTGMDVGGGGAAPATSSITTSTTPNIQDPRVDQLYNLLLGQAQQSQTENPNDPVIKAQTDAYSADQTRSTRNYLDTLAEQSGPNANLSGQTAVANEKQAQATSGFQANLMAQDLQAKRDQIQQALTSMGSLLTQEQQMNLQAQLASMNDALSRLSLAQNEGQFQQNLGYEYDAPYLHYGYDQSA